MKAIILGGSRFIGRRLARELAGAGHAVTLFNRGRTDDLLGGAVERLRGERRSATDLAAAARRQSYDVVYDFLCYDETDARLAAEAFRGRAGRFVHISTCSVYWCAGECPCPVAEEDFDRLDVSAERPGSIEFEYGTGKRRAEESLRRAHGEGAFPVTIVRMPIVGGEEDASLRYAGYVERVLSGGPIVLPDGGLAPFRHVYVGDVCRALADLALAPAAAGEAYNLAGGEILSLRRVVGAIASALGHRPELVDAPGAFLRAVDPRPPSATFSPFSQAAAQVPAIFKARRDLGWSPTPFEAWVERAVRWAASRPGRAAEPPPSMAHRDLEREIARRWRTAAVSFGAEPSTSSAPPG
ncbi:MAG TPA: NAD-dependent epimerase/dehydratase family protein [Candidatus Polarisedimenticolia bacterium]|nr:NAD-dependent epimerase/dehydratase family protein [Candidatus Polarisedimenticolia bacterium]